MERAAESSASFPRLPPLILLEESHEESPKNPPPPPPPTQSNQTSKQLGTKSQKVVYYCYYQCDYFGKNPKSVWEEVKRVGRQGGRRGKEKERKNLHHNKRGLKPATSGSKSLATFPFCCCCCCFFKMKKYEK